MMLWLLHLRMVKLDLLRLTIGVLGLMRYRLHRMGPLEFGYRLNAWLRMSCSFDLEEGDILWFESSGLLDR